MTKFRMAFVANISRLQVITISLCVQIACLMDLLEPLTPIQWLRIIFDK